jgi:adenylate kinase family enzyme
MANYDFSTLNDKDLEVLVCDLFTREFGVNFQSFKVGKDKGIDLRYSTIKSENEIIVQVKHYLKSGFNQLINTLKTKEKEKIDRLCPKRYILVTSIGLSPTDKEKLKTTLDPYISNTNDIFGCDDLNMLISKYEDLEKKHFKLWFSNVNIIQKIVNNGIDGRSGFIAETIKKNLGLYVVNESYEKALKKLREHKVLLITGVPGIGKTTLANLITYRLLSRDYRLVYIDDKIREGEDLFDDDLNVKQLFYFDDFLGSNYLEIINSRNTDKSIVNFIERVKVTPKKYLILTTRTTILNQARSIHEKLSRANLDSLKYEIEISNYNDYEKAKILYNHLYFNDIPIEMTAELFRDKRYKKIIKHRNYNPRLIEFFTLFHNIDHLKPNEYFDFIIYHLENPGEIWESAISNQLSEEEKYLIFTLLTLGRNVDKEVLEMAFEERIGNEVIRYGFSRRVNVFNISFKNLLNGYITNSYYSQWGTKSHVNYINPSLRDYLILYFNRNSSEKWRLIESFVFIEQFLIPFKLKKPIPNYVFIEFNEIRKFLEIANSKKLKSIEVTDTDNLNLRLAHLYSEYRHEENKEYIDSLIIERFRSIDWGNIVIRFFSDLVPILIFAEPESRLYDFIKANWDNIITKLISIINEDLELDKIKELFDYYDNDYGSYLESEYWEDLVHAAINRIYRSEAKEIIEQEQNEVYSESDYDSMEEKVQDKYNELSNKYLFSKDLDPTFDPFEEVDKETLISENLKASAEADAHQDDWREYEHEIIDNDSLIDDLFSSFDK